MGVHDYRTSIEFYFFSQKNRVFHYCICLNFTQNTVVLDRSMYWERRSIHVYRSSKDIC